MISNPFFLLSILSSSLFAFFTIAFFVEFLIKIVKIKQYRWKSTLRLLPFISLIIDLTFSHYSVGYWINPLSCSGCIQKIILILFFPDLKLYLGENEISLISYLGGSFQHIIFSATFGLFGGLSLLLVLRKIINASVSMKHLNAVAKRGHVSRTSFISQQLTDAINKNNIIIYVSNEIQIPLTVYPRTIIIPENTIKLLTQLELEAVIAHESEHIIHNDALIRLFYHSVADFFWWIPTHSWIKKIEEEQELACDQNVVKYGLSGSSIASALYKVTKEVNAPRTICCFNSLGNFTVSRVETALGLTSKTHNLLGINFFGLLFGILFIGTCMMFA